MTLPHNQSVVAAESVGIGHPDKVADQISDAILDAYLAQDPKARVDCTCVLSHDTLFLAGEITSDAKIDIEQVAKSVLSDIGYTSKDAGFDANSCKTVIEITEQSNEIANAVSSNFIASDPSYGAGDQAIAIGYATNETPEYMPLPVVLAHKLVQALYQKRPHLGPDGKTLVGVRYEDNKPIAVEYIVFSCQHTKDISLDEVRNSVRLLIKDTLESSCSLDKTKLLVNPGGSFVIAGPSADTGLTGRKLAVDTYGTSAHHGGGALSGKDPTKIDRSASYAARYIAKNIVAANIAKKCEVALSYAIGMPKPIGVSVNTFGTSTFSDQAIAHIIPKVFDLSVLGIINALKLQRPIYQKTAWGGHFGRNDPTFTWEATDKTQELLKHFNLF